MRNMSKKNIIIVAIVVLVVLIFGVLQYRANNANTYSVVYLTTGEVYVGKLTVFPNMELTNGYILQMVKDPTDSTKSNFQLNPIKEALWAPESMRLIKENVVFYGQLLPTSKIAETITAQKK